MICSDPSLEYHERWMRRCLQLARCGEVGARPNPMVGAVVVWKDEVIGEGFHARFGEAHAEVNAIRRVKDESRLRESTLYVSLEPCSHYGKTPPCAKLIIEKGIPRVVVGMVDPFPEVRGRGIEMLRQAGVDVKVGVLEEECRRLNAHFVTVQTKGRPYVTLKWAQSADGFVAPEQSNGGKIHVSNALTLTRVHKLRSRHQAILVGSRTALVDDPELTLRYWSGKAPLRVVIDRKGTLPPGLRLFDGTTPTLVVGYRDNAMRAKVAVGAYEFREIDEQGDELGQLMAILREKGIESLLVEGGPMTHRLFIEAGLWDCAKVEIGSGFFGEGVAAPKLDGAKLERSEVVGGHRLLTLVPGEGKGTEMPHFTARPQMKGQELLRSMRKQIAPVYGEGEAKAVVRELLAQMFGLGMTEVYCDKLGDLATPEGCRRLESAVERLSKGEPVQYVTGKASFCGSTFAVTPAVLIPRPETEQLTGRIIEDYADRRSVSIIDLATGSGCVAIALALRLMQSRVVGVDISEQALVVARENVERLSEECGRRLNVELVRGDITQVENLPDGRFDVVVSNPPYVHPDEEEAMPVWVKGFEPRVALFAPAKDPLYYYRYIGRWAAGHLGERGRLYLEINPLYADALREVLSADGLGKVELLKDEAGRKRFAVAERG